MDAPRIILTEIPEEFELWAGAVVQMRFEWKAESTYGRAIQWALIESKLTKQYDEFEVLRYTNTDQHLIVEVRVKEPVKPELQTAGITPAAIMVILELVVAGLFAWAWNSRQMYLKRQMETQYAQTATGRLEAGSKLTLALAALAAVIVFGLIKLK
jgi:ferric-dicitrate binding protein FerR (iron transport regulator)